MVNILKGDSKLLENKNYYNNIFVKIKNENNIFNIASILRIEDNISFTNYNLIFRFYKIKSFRYDIPLEYVIKILNEKYPYDVVDTIIKHYLKNDISFDSIKQNDKSNDTLIIKANIRHLKSPEPYQNIINYPDLQIKEGKYIKSIISKILGNLEKMIKKKNHIDINEIFSIKEKNILSFVYKIHNSQIAWGMTF